MPLVVDISFESRRSDLREANFTAVVAERVALASRLFAIKVLLPPVTEMAVEKRYGQMFGSVAGGATGYRYTTLTSKFDSTRKNGAVLGTL